MCILQHVMSLTPKQLMVICAQDIPEKENVTNHYCLTLRVSGWEREIVIRGVQSSGSAARRCDIYYYAPDNTKLVCESLIFYLIYVACVSSGRFPV